MNRRFTAVLLAAIFSLLLALYAAPVFAANASDWTVPAGYNANDYTKVRTFLELTDSSGEANWQKLAAHEDSFSFDDPSTWSCEWIEEGLVSGFTWSRSSSSGENRLVGVDMNLDMVGDIDLSGCSELSYINVAGPITSLDLTGCNKVKSIWAVGTLIRAINWSNPSLAVSISISAEGHGYVGNKQQDRYHDSYHYALATPEEGYTFTGWYDESGNLVSGDAEYVYANTSSSQLSNVTVDLTARFVKEGEEPANPTEPVDPTEPASPTEPTEPTEPAAPTEPTEPSDPGVPSTGAFSLVCIGAVTAISGISLIVLRKK